MVKVALGERAYNIHVGSDLLATAGSGLLAGWQRKRIVIVTDENVANFHLKPLKNSLETAKISCEVTILSPGEHIKDFRHLEQLLNWLLDIQVERGDTILALGGGVIGDLTGLAASLLRRGINIIQAPTTLLAQVDSSVGGKTAINTRHGKNLVGTFHQPSVVMADITTLATLDKRDLRAGYAEVVKYGLINAPDFFYWLETHARDILSGDLNFTQYAVVKSCQSKARIVEMDEKEGGSRALLNLGHTFAHALEAEIAYTGNLLHGEAVAIGIVMAFDLSVELGVCPVEEAERVRQHIARTGLPTKIKLNSEFNNIDPGRLMSHMHQDKKVKNGKLTFILARGIGKAFVAPDIEEPAVLAVLKKHLLQ